MVPCLPHWSGTIPKGRYVPRPWNLGGSLVCWDRMTRGCTPVHKHRRLFSPKSGSTNFIRWATFRAPDVSFPQERIRRTALWTVFYWESVFVQKIPNPSCPRLGPTWLANGVRFDYALGVLHYRKKERKNDEWCSDVARETRQKKEEQNTGEKERTKSCL